jgi:ribosomal-protein-alanine N-acetyltransferase
MNVMNVMNAGCAHRLGVPARTPRVPETGTPETETAETETPESEPPAVSTGLPSGSIEIIPVRWWHLPEMAEVEARVHARDSWSQEMFWSELAQGSARCYLAAVRAGQIIGYAGLATHADESFVQTMVVDVGERRRGVATRLLAALLRHARTAGAYSCGLEVRTDNHAAHALYSRFGFVDIGLRHGYYQLSGGDAFVMRVRPIDTVGYAALLDAVDPEAAR